MIERRRRIDAEMQATHNAASFELKHSSEFCMTAPPNSPSEATVLSEEAFQAVVVPGPRRRRGPLFWLLLLGAGLGLLCFSGCLIFSLFCEAKRVTTPAEVLQAAQEMTDLAVPEGYEGELAETVSMPICVVRKAQFRHVSGKGVLTLVSMRIHWISNSDEAEAIRGGFEQLAGEKHQIIAESESIRTLTIRNEPAEFGVRFGSDTLSSTKYHEIRGVFRGKTGLTQLWLQAEDSIWDAATIDRLLDSL